MSNAITNSQSFEALQMDLKEKMRQTLEDTVNQLLKDELSAVLGYEPYAVEGHHSGNSRNGYYDRDFQTEMGIIHLRIPRDRAGLFTPHTVPAYARRCDTLESMVIHMYSHGVTTSEIARMIEKMYGCHYSRQTVSNITQAMQEQVEAFHHRPIHDKYVAVYCDATYINVRRDSVAKEALHVIVGIDEDGHKEILDYALYPTESAAHYRDMLEGLKSRGLEKVLLFVTDGLSSIREALLESYPEAEHQTCWTHIVRHALGEVRVKDRRAVVEGLRAVYQANSEEEARDNLTLFLEQYKRIYSRLTEKLSDISSLFSFYHFPPEIRRSIYTSNLIEGLNKQLKRGIKRKEQFPDSSALDRYICSVYCQENQKYGDRVHPGFMQARAELLKMF